MRRALLVVLLACLVGCFEEELTLEVQPGGEGRLQIERTLTAELSRTIPDAEAYAANALAEWRGLVAWSDVVALRQGERITLRATGWFRDANLVTRTTARDGLRVSLTRGPGSVDVAVVEQPGVTGQRLLAAPDLEPDRLLTARALAGFRRRMTLVLPGEAVRPRGLALVPSERVRVSFERTRADVEAQAKDLSERAKALAKRVAVKELNSEAASEQLGAELKQRASHRVRCHVKPGAQSSPAFRRELLAALAQWPESPWSARVRRAREALGETADDAPLDSFEPNDSEETAALLPIGPREGLLCSGEDWYRVKVPAGQELHVSLGFEHAQGDLDLELFGPIGASRSDSQGDGEAASLSVLAKESQVLVRVHGAWAAYTLTTRLCAAQDADLHEPNDTFETARSLTPDRYSGLVCNGEDWYRVEVPEGSGLRAEVKAPARAGDLDLALYAPDRSLLGRSARRADTEVVTLDPGPARIVFVRVFGAYAAYAISLHVAEETPPK